MSKTGKHSRTKNANKIKIDTDWDSSDSDMLSRSGINLFGDASKDTDSQCGEATDTQGRVSGTSNSARSGPHNSCDFASRQQTGFALFLNSDKRNNCLKPKGQRADINAAPTYSNGD